MAKDWKNITDKLESETPPAFSPNDWEAMQEKIAANPSLQVSAGKKGAWIWGASILIIGSVITALILLPWNKEAVLSQPNVSNETNAPEDNTERVKKTNDNMPNGLNTNAVASGTNKSEALDYVEKEEVTSSWKKIDQPLIGSNPKQKGRSGIEPGQSIANTEPNSTVANADESSLSANTEKGAEEWTGSNSTERTSASNSNKTTAAADSDNRNIDAGFNELDEPNGSKELFTKIKTVASIEPKSISLFEAKDVEVHSETEMTLDNSVNRVSPKSRKAFPFRLGGIQLGGALITDGVNAGYGASIGLDFQLKNWLLQTGLNQYTVNQEVLNIKLINTVSFEVTDVQVLQNDTITRIDSNYVITGPFMGDYVYDTTTVINQDTIIQQQVDTIRKSEQLVERTRIEVGYSELPLYVGYRIRRNRWSFDLVGGAILGKTTYAGADEAYTDEYDLKLAFRPGVRYFIKPNWAVYSNVGVRYSLTPNQLFEPFGTSIHLGISYHW